MYLFQLFHEYFWRKNRYHYILVKTIFYTTPQKIGLRSPPMNGAWLYLPPPRNETSVTREYKRAPPWIGGELQRLRLTKSHRVGHLQRAQGDICMCDLFHLQGSYSFSLCMAFVHHPSFSTTSQTIQRDAKATVAPNPGWIMVQRSDDIPKRLAQAPPFHWTCCQLQENSEGLKIQI